MFEWDAGLLLGAPAVDGQHQELFRRAHALAGALRDGENVQRLEELFGFLERYAVHHFSAEEALMRQSAYPDLAAHVRQHQALTDRLRAVREQFEGEGDSPTLVLVLLGLLDAWLRTHVGGSDRLLANHLRAGEARPS